MIGVAYTTAPRPRSTLEESVASYRRAGFTGRLLVFSDGPCDLATPETEVLINEVKLGALRNWVRALSVLTTGPDEWVMVCQDDISWSKDAQSKLLTDLAKHGSLQRAGVLSLYAPRRMTKLVESGGRLDNGWHHKGMQIGFSMWGAQCLLFTKLMAQNLLNDPTFKEFLADKKRVKNIDAIVSHCVNARGRNVVYRIPCLVNHDLGEANSSIGNKNFRPGLATDYFDGLLA